ncbi:MAG TPA: hypothetical protein PK986_06230 [Spirochaetota bacterium]|nr:SH3 domain-containing protein [Spirochaetota bacterium]HQO40048.1 hypothetical protein [Spirochaetota bacterium]
MKIRNFTALPALTLIISALLMPLLPVKNNADEIYTLTPEYLASTAWKTAPDDADGTMEITFTPDGHFKFIIDLIQSYIDASGTYSIKDGKLSLMIEDSNMGRANIGSSLDGGIILTDKNSPKYSRYLYFKEIRLKEFYLNVKELVLWDTSSVVKEGKSVSIKGIEAVTMGIKEAVVTNPLKMRETPDRNGKEINITNTDSDSEEPPVVVKALPKGHKLLVLARTKEKSIVGKWNNYWYYVEFELYETRRAWVYGEFLKFK